MENENLVLNKKNITPLFFVDKGQISVKVYVIYDINTGEIYSATNLSLQSVYEITGVEQICYEFVFTKPNYQQLSNYKQLSSYWDSNASKKIINIFKLRSYLIVNHLKSWKNIVNELGQEVLLQLDADDTLTQSSLNLVYEVNPFVMEAIMKEYQSKIHLNFDI